MNIIVCVKQALDPETPVDDFKIDAGANRILPGPNNPPVVSTFDENAVEAALQIKDKKGSGKVTVVTCGPATGRDAIKHVMAMGADEGVLLVDDAFNGIDSYGVAYVLAQAIKKIGQYDLILCGRQSPDWSSGRVGSGMAEYLGLPCVTMARKVEESDGKIKIERIIEGGAEAVEVSTPALVTVSNEIGAPRYPTLRGIMAAGKKPVATWSAKDLEIDPAKVGPASRESYLKLVKLYIPSKDIDCEIIEADSEDAAGEQLALTLRANKII